MTRDQIIETMARAMCESIFPNCDARPEGSPWVSTWDRERGAFSEQATAALSALEAAGLAVVPVEPTRTICEAIVDAAEIYDEYGFDKCVSNPDAVYEAILAAAQRAQKP